MPSIRYAATVNLSRFADWLWWTEQANDRDPAILLYLDLKKDWIDLVEATPEAGFQATAAWFLATCPYDAINDVEQTAKLARVACGSAPDNQAFRIILGFAELKEVAVDEFDAPNQATLIKLALLRALVAGQSTQSHVAKQAYLHAQMLRKDSAPGDWELMMLSKFVESRLSIDVEQNDVSSPAQKGE